MSASPPATDPAFFVLLVRKGSLSACARELDITVSAVSKRLAQLEGKIGRRLINRTTRRLALSPDGQVYFEHATRIVDQIEELERTFATRRSVPKGLLRVNAPMGFGRTYIAPVISAFRRAQPNVEVQLHLTDRPVNLNDKEFDVAIRFGELPDARIIAKRIAQNRRLLCAAPAYLAAREVPKRPDDLLKHQCVVLRQNDSGFGLWRLTRDGVTTSVKVAGALSSNDGEVTLVWALDGHGILMRAEWDLARYFRSGRLKQVLPEYALPPADIFAVYAESDHEDPKVVAFVEFLASRFANDKVREADGTAPW